MKDVVATTTDGSHFQLYEMEEGDEATCLLHASTKFGVDPSTVRLMVVSEVISLKLHTTKKEAPIANPTMPVSSADEDWGLAEHATNAIEQMVEDSITHTEQTLIGG